AVLNRQILELDPNNIVALNNLAWILCEEKGQYQEALQLANRGLRIRKEYTDLLDTRGVIYYRLGAADPAYYEKAEADFVQCLEWYPVKARAGVATRFHLARVYAKTGRETEALRELRKTLSSNRAIGGLSPEDEADAQDLLTRLQGG
ncbi:MAG TPA: tetratricopeptide repeat protein, partial [Phycisphaerales bacterium]|nr:tetratricopeptide repeat protein [Phycisphaerales bacterium]